jgi:hypothetical protein
MRRTHVIGAAAVALVVLVAAVAAYANAPADQTTFALTVTGTPKDAGTKAKPKAKKITLGMKGDTVPPGGSPATSTDVIIQMPSTHKWMGAKWPRSKRCSPDTVEEKEACPRGSKVGSGDVVASNRNETTGQKLSENIKLTAFVLKSGGLGLFVEGTSPLTFAALLPGKISNKNTKISVRIPENVQEPLQNVNTGIEDLTFTLNGKIKVKGKTYGAVSTVGCKKGGKEKTKVTNVYRPENGVKKQNVDSDTTRCTK